MARERYFCVLLSWFACIKEAVSDIVLQEFALLKKKRTRKEQKMERSFKVKGEDLGLASLVKIVFSWNLNDVLNENLCKHKVVFLSFLF